MIKVMQVLLPVAAMMGIGFLCRTFRLLDRGTVDGMKFLITKIILPIAVLNALATASFTGSSFRVIGVMLVMLAVSFGLGFLMKPLMPQAYRKYTPYMVSVYEGGMIAYPLYINLVGAENISNIVLLDIAGLIFGFSVYMGMLAQEEEGTPLNPAGLLREAFRSNTFIAALIGLALGLTGAGAALQASAAGPVIDEVVELVTSPMSAVILLIVGYEFSPDRALLGPCLRTILLRAGLQALMMAGVLAVLHGLAWEEPPLYIAVIIYMSAPATFSMQSFIKTPEGSAYVSTANSLYCLVSIAVYAAAAAMYL